MFLSWSKKEKFWGGIFYGLTQKHFAREAQIILRVRRKLIFDEFFIVFAWRAFQFASKAQMVLRLQRIVFLLEVILIFFWSAIFLRVRREDFELMNIKLCADDYIFCAFSANSLLPNLRVKRKSPLRSWWQLLTKIWRSILNDHRINWAS